MIDNRKQFENLTGSFQVYQPGVLVEGLISKISHNNGVMRSSGASTFINKLDTGISQMSNISPSYNKNYSDNNSM